jgi:hypothetical protein
MSNMAEIIAVLSKALSNMQKDKYYVDYSGKCRAVNLAMFGCASNCLCLCVRMCVYWPVYMCASAWKATEALNV